ncbi:hypothetical protein IBT50_25630 [Bacillus sp. S70]|uniref:hypothetical protein n=1 Tax=unclassified Bacillus (in: firmicutes) TaxID=185979 RepID=UPI00190BFBD7|nr:MULTISPECIES: hypothetical protein [unclassified Bacillus (in: firmicutes)]MBJ9983594.1 hypothetical protein [Bacillus sp. S29]MBK0104745.1 hypothetical protein [Bacillus sp. S70]MBK0110006.1 hypothetical protein [Bacillus sp. S73]MBK0138872.1 hypothetical protein [Bacillus sp. S72]MBK0147977.1 hypothetical protein [Bacillus sp. S74]
MKKRLSLILAIALGIGSLTACGDSEKTTKTETKQASADVKKTSETKEIPTKRTIELPPGSTYPWQGTMIEEANKHIDKGEIVYLMSDLEPYEKAIVSTIDLDILKNGGDPQVSKMRTDQLVKQLKPLDPKMNDYFDKLTEVGNLVAAKDYDGAKAKIEEAKKLREAK